MTSRGKGSRRKVKRDRKMVLKEEKLKKGKKKEISRNKKSRRRKIVVEALLNSRATGLVMSLEFARKNKFKKKLERSIYMRNIDSISNHKELIEHTVEVELFYKGHKERTEIDIIGGQKWSIILGIL